MMFGYISAHLNPATCLALWVIGKARRRRGHQLSVAKAVQFRGAARPCPMPHAPLPSPPPAEQIPFTHALALAAAEFAGAFLGACLVFLHFLPHFKTLPEPMVPSADELLLRRWACGRARVV